MYGVKGFGTGAAAGSAGAAAQGLHVLPFTGMNVVELAVAGFVLLAAGQAMARLIPRRRRRRRWSPPEA
jgi:hypothetical protein